MTQSELAQGICKQAAISNLENNNISININALQQICERLELTLNDIFIETEQKQLKEKLNLVEKFCMVSKNEKAKQVIDKIDINSIKDASLRSKAEYYYALLEYLITGQDEAAFFYFNKILSNTSSSDLYNILANNGLGIIFEGKKSFKFAESYYDKSLHSTRELKKTPLNLVQIFYNSARFYSSINDYDTAISLCEEGISINKTYQSTFQLEYLLYEKAFNSYKLDKPEYISIFKRAKDVAMFNNNEYIVDVINDDLNKIQTHTL
ncbi:hypothetical protein C7K38_11070 [Tetragenococcus osmophilus]|uniref:Transcriptional regulator n=1 Tax=Tetragenococcus osmophilus TaxID=526944 RepID=A0AA38CTH2_9ENTE|nr:helix-turn-helix domain-containing protein [Tetragenococcus osmophilus]AYW48872.1 hypothetical protein C7K38_11070 [Tetragenococcus osmophilus]GMA54898.1 transcriptional regulator [Alicyclobacillus contaminans]GMA71303.1 transcriptional regulator [Tetragenococcus osmophilus]